jgi:hypothetical protein
MHSVHAGYTVIARLEENTADTVSALLVEMRAHPERLPFEACATTHFATCTVLPAQLYEDEELPACLMIATSFCGPADVHENELVQVAGSGLRELLQYAIRRGCKRRQHWKARLPTWCRATTGSRASTMCRCR